jgi:magnesium transporter
MHSVDAARVLEQADARDAAPFIAGLPPIAASQVMSCMSLAAAAEYLSLLAMEAAVAVTTELPISVVASLLRRLDPKVRADLLAELPPERSSQIARMLEYADGTVGAALDPEVLAIPSDVTNEAARRLLRRRGGLFHHQLYVVDRSRRLLGYLHVRDLVRAVASEPVMKVMRPATMQLQATAKLATVMSHPAWRDMDAIPVVDRTGVLLGILRHRQLRGLGSQAGTPGVTSTLVGLSELYWIGLSSLLPSIPPVPYKRVGAERGGDNAS